MVVAIPRQPFECMMGHKHKFVNMGQQLHPIEVDDGVEQLIPAPWNTWMCVFCHMRMEIFFAREQKEGETLEDFMKDEDIDLPHME